MKKITITLFTLLALSQFAYASYSDAKHDFFLRSSSTGLGGLYFDINATTFNADADRYAESIATTFFNTFKNALPESITVNRPQPFGGTRNVTYNIADLMQTVEENIGIDNQRAVQAIDDIIGFMSLSKRYSSITFVESKDFTQEQLEQYLNDIYGSAWFNQTYSDFLSIGASGDYSSLVAKIDITNPIPLDGGLSFLLASGLGLGIFRRFRNKKWKFTI